VRGRCGHVALAVGAVAGVGGGGGEGVGGHGERLEEGNAEGGR
jgi:hypothetical protein